MIARFTMRPVSLVVALTSPLSGFHSGDTLANIRNRATFFYFRISISSSSIATFPDNHLSSIRKLINTIPYGYHPAPGGNTEHQPLKIKSNTCRKRAEQSVKPAQ
ncbi:MAG: hypothetical protein WBP54_00320 [Pelodictyon phaeoclathratiforme]